ncbi:MAG: hypothetical protein RLZ55_787 [Actinomycetota bacterium]
MTDWGRSTALITGAGQGMGRGLALSALARGGDVVAWDVNASLLEALAADGSGLPGSLRTECVDVSDRDLVNSAARQAGAIDILVNNAGITSHDHLLHEDPAAIERVMGVNSLALFWTTQALLDQFVDRDSGHIVTVASAAGFVPLAGAVAYTASKHAAVGFHRALRQELRAAAPHVQTTLVAPFFVGTGMFDGVGSRFPWLLPIVDESDAVNHIVTAVERDRTNVTMPPMAKLASLFGVLPTGVADVLLDQLGINASMSTFRGRADRTADRR